MTAAAAVAGWHAVLASKDPDALDALLADAVVFHSPVVHTPQRGKTLTRMYLQAAMRVLGDADFRYRREVVQDHHAVLEFTACIDGIEINGVDMIEADADGRIIDFKVMVRPLQAVNLLHRKMGEMLQRHATARPDGDI